MIVNMTQSYVLWFKDLQDDVIELDSQSNATDPSSGQRGRALVNAAWGFIDIVVSRSVQEQLLAEGKDVAISETLQITVEGVPS